MMIKVNSIYDFPRMPGIYKFTNKINGKVYIGETEDFKTRMSGYRCAYKNKNIIHLISRAITKYGIEGFHYEILELFPHGVSKEVSLDREEFWIRIYNSTDKTIGYNITKRGRNRKGVVLSKEVRERMSRSNLGKKLSQETCIRMSLSNRGENHWSSRLGNKKHPAFGVKFSKERSEKIRQSLTAVLKDASRKRINQIDPRTGEVIKTFESICSAAKEVNGHKRKYHGISNILKGKHQLAYGFKWEYAK